MSLSIDSDCNEGFIEAMVEATVEVSHEDRTVTVKRLVAVIVSNAGLELSRNSECNADVSTSLLLKQGLSD